VSILLMTILLLLTGGCGHKYHLSDEYVAQGSAEGLQGAGFDGRLDVIWESDFNGKPSGPLSIHKGVLAIPSAKRRIEFRATATGENLGRVKTKGIVHTDLLYYDSLMIFGVEPPRGRVVCWDLKRHKEVWRFQVRDVVGIAALSQDQVLVADRSGRLTVLNIVTGEIVWSLDLESRISARPFIHKGTPLIGGDDGRVHAIDLDSASVLWRSPSLGSPIIALSQSTVAKVAIAVTSEGILRGISWFGGGLGHGLTNLSEGRWSTPVVLWGSGVILTSSHGEVLSQSGMETLWRYDTEQAIRAAPTVVDGIVIVATLRGKVISLNGANGEMIAQRAFGSAIRQSPVTDGMHVFVATHSGAIVCLGAR
jgi:outer membrane protein assembly factor BamB